MANDKISAEQRLQNFNILTRQSLKQVASKSSLAVGTEYSIDFPKTRYLSNTYLRIQGTLNAIHASNSTYAAHEDAPFSLINRVSIDMNDGFLPISLTGKALSMYNMTLFKNAPTLLASATSGQRALTVQGLTSSATTGTDNTIDFMLQLPNTLNKRDGVGLINLQGDQQLGTIKFTMGQVADIAPASSGYTFALSGLSATVYTESFTIPQPDEARPDLSILKQVLEKYEVLSAAENTIKLPVGPGIIYRKIIFIVYSTAPARQADSIITSPIKLMLNQNDIPYEIPPYLLARINSECYGAAMPTGVFVFDFANQGIVNMGGSRDYIDTSDMTEFWLQFTTSAAGYCRVITEQIHLAKTGGKAAL